MSVTIRTAKIIALISFLMINGLHENGVPNLVLLGVYVYHFFSDLSDKPYNVFWEGLIVIPILVALIVFALNKNFKILLISFVILLASLIYTTGILNNFFRIDFWFVFIFLVFLTSSIFVLFKTQKRTR